jgi:hypothetical protein
VLDVEAFIDRGYVRLPGAVDPEVATSVRQAAEALVVPDGQAWQLGLATVYDVPALVGAISPAVRTGMDAVLGAGRWFCDSVWGFPTGFPGPAESIWHFDGDWFTHHLSSPEQVLSPLFLWQDTGDDDGPTLLRPGSHHAIARIVAAAEPYGIPGSGTQVDVEGCAEVVPAVGRAGDVYLCHPFLLHAVNPDGPRARRVISNVAVHHWGPLPFRSGDLNAVERAMVQTVTPTAQPMA